MSVDRESTLRPLRACGDEIALLRGGTGGEGMQAAAVVRLAGAVETTLRRLLRDDPTAPVDLRLRALSPDDLPTDGLLAELRQRDRVPLELAAGVHELKSVEKRIREGMPPSPRDAQLASTVAEGLERHILSLPAATPLRDPVVQDEETRFSPESQADVPAHPVPPSRRPRLALGATLAALLVVLVAGALWWRGRAGGDLARGQAAFSRGDVAAAEVLFRRHADAHPGDVESRLHLAQIQRGSGRQEDALRSLREALAASPSDPRLHVELGNLLLDARRNPEAAERFRTAVGLDPQSERAWVGLVRALRASGRPDAAERVLLTAPREVRAVLTRAPSTAPTPP